MTIGSAHGHYPGEPNAVTYRIEMVDMTQPSQVTLNGRVLGQEPSSSNSPGWNYQASTTTVVVDTPFIASTGPATVVATGVRPVDLPEPPVPST